MAAEVIQVNDLLKSDGLSTKNVIKLPKVSEEFLQEYKAIINEEYSKIHTNASRSHNVNSVSSTNSDAPYFKEVTKKVSFRVTDEFVSQWDFANSVAKMNMQRDSNARNENKETVYMYMSHFIDIRNGINNSVDYARSISDDDYFSSWITNKDRNTYDSYFEGVRDGKNFLAQVDIIEAGINSIDNLLEVRSFRKNLGEINNILNCKHLFLYDYCTS